MHIGILEDNPAIRDVFQLALELEGHTVETYTTGVSLLAQLLPETSAHALPYDVLLIDLGLPGALSGRDVIQCLADSDRPPPMMVISAAAPSELERVQRAFPAVRILRKPLPLDLLFQAIEELNGTPWAFRQPSPAGGTPPR